MAKRITVVDKNSDELLVTPNEDYIRPAQSQNLDLGLLGDNIAPGFRKICLGCPIGNGGMNLVIHGGGDGVHQHWQKICNPEKTEGYWQNVTGQANQHRKNNPISKLVEEHS